MGFPEELPKEYGREMLETVKEAFFNEHLKMLLHQTET